MRCHIMRYYAISIHAPLTGSDSHGASCVLSVLISIHAPLTGSDRGYADFAAPVNISIHAPLTGSDERKALNTPFGQISIHAPLTGSDGVRQTYCLRTSEFQSTLPSQGATANIHIKFLCDLLFSTLSSKNSFTLSRFPQTIT